MEKQVVETKDAKD
jgi:N-acetylneuraminic acid mutarotase